MPDIVLDTHILAWRVDGSHRLSSTAAQVIDDTLASGAKVVVSSISVWEIAMLVRKGRLTLSMDVEIWLDQVVQTGGFYFMPVDNDIACKSIMLPGNFHKDPADRIIVATARKLNAPLITHDARIIDYEHVRTTPGSQNS